MARRAEGDNNGLQIGEIDADRFADFARRHGRSEEVGPIATVFDGPRDLGDGADVHALGLFGCGRLCAVSATLHTQPTDGRAGGIKLDSVIVDRQPRRRGLAGLIVAKAFHYLLSDPGRSVSAVYAHAVHPATVRLLGRMSFTRPPPTGAPISSLPLDDDARQELVAHCGAHVQRATDRLRLQCCLCMERNRRARPWCGQTGAPDNATNN